MDRDLIPFPHHSDQRIGVEAILLAAGATVARPIGIIGEKLRAARPEGAIVEGLHGACHEHAIRSAGVGSAILPFRHHTIVSRGEHRVHADGQLMFRVEALERMHQLDVRSCLVNGDEPGPRHFPQACADSTLEIARRRRRNRAGQQTRRVVEKNARRLPLGAFSDFAAFRRGGLRRDPGALERQPIPPHGEAVQTAEQHRMIRHALAEQLHVWIMVGPRAFVPSPADNPLPFRRLSRSRLDTLHRLGVGFHADQAHPVERRAELGDVHVRIDETGNNGAAGRVDDLRLRPFESKRLRVRADERDASAPDRHRLGVGMPPAGRVRRICGRTALAIGFVPRQRVHAAVDDHDVGRRRCEPREPDHRHERGEKRFHGHILSMCG